MMASRKKYILHGGSTLLNQRRQIASHIFAGELVFSKCFDAAKCKQASRRRSSFIFSNRLLTQVITRIIKANQVARISRTTAASQ